MIKQKNVLLVLISFTLLTFAWMGFSFYHASVASTIDETLSIQIQPIPDRFDDLTLSALSQRTDISPVYEVDGFTPPQATPSAETPPESELSETPTEEDVTTEPETEEEEL